MKSLSYKTTLLSLLTVFIAFYVSTVAGFAQNAPAVTSISPLEGPVGTQVEIRGNNLTNTTAVKFGTVDASFSLLGESVIAVVPVSAANGPVRVVTPNGEAASSNSFTVTALQGPVITSFTPVQGSVGSTVEIKGQNFAGVQSVQFNGVDATFTLGNDSLSVQVPTGATTGAIKVTTPGGVAVSSQVFTVLLAGKPSITSFSPTSGSPGVSVQITGTNLAMATAVQFNGVNASFLSSGQTLQATVPATASSGPITITTPGGTAVSTDIFTLISGPVITNITPSTGGFGTVVAIRGTLLKDVVSVKFADMEAVFTNASFARLYVSAVVPTNAVSGPITVTTKTGTTVSADIFTIDNPTGPSISSFTPLSAEAGIPIDIKGTNLTNIVSVSFGGTNATFTEFTSGRLFAFVPQNAPTGPITIITANGRAVSQDVFTPSTAPALPVIDSFSPLTGLVGSTVTIKGTNLTDVVSVSFGGASATFESVNSSQLTARVPTNAVAGSITIVTAKGTVTSKDAFTPTSIPVVPVIDSFSPLTGPVGSTVTIKGTNLIDVVSVSFGGASATFESINSGQLTARVPTNAVAGPITIVTAKGTVTSKDAFTPSGNPEPPTLSIRMVSAEKLELSWNAGTSTFAVESTANLGSPTSWTPFTGQPVIQAGQATLSIDIGSGSRFFRLVAQ